MEDTIPSSDSERSALLSDPALRSALMQALRKRVPESDVEDIAQATLTDALLATTAPADAVELRRWVHGILRNKVADFYRQRRREVPFDSDAPEAPAESASLDDGARDLLRWAEKELPEGGEAPGTLDWMLREGDGEKLETIAREERVPAPRVRQRIARLRRHFRTRWAAQLAAVGALSILALLVVLIARRFNDERKPLPIAEEPVPPRGVERAQELRRAAIEECRRGKYRECLDGLDGAKRLDHPGDETNDVRAARSVATQALAPAPSAAPSASEAPSPLAPPTSSATPVTKPAPTTSFMPTPVAPPAPTNTVPAKAPFPRKPKATKFPSSGTSVPSD